MFRIEIERDHMRELLSVGMCVLIGLMFCKAMQIWADVEAVNKESVRAEINAKARAEENMNRYGLTYAPVR